MSVVAERDFSGERADARALIARVRRHAWWVICSIVLWTAAFGAVAFLMVPVYRATVVLAPAAADRGGDALGLTGNQLGGLASGLGLGGGRTVEADEALAVLRSRGLTETFITSMNLMPKLFARKWNPVTQTWKVEKAKQPTLGKAYKYFDEKIRSIVQDRRTGLVTLQIDWKDPEEAAAWANELVRLLNEEMRSRAISKADASLSFLDKELQRTTSVEVRGAVSRLIETQVKQRMLADVTPDYSFRIVDKAEASDRDDPIRPQKLVLISIGFLLGALVGVAAVLLFGFPYSNARGA